MAWQCCHVDRRGMDGQSRHVGCHVVDRIVGVHVPEKITGVHVPEKIEI